MNGNVGRREGMAQVREVWPLSLLEEAAVNIKCIGNLMESLSANREMSPESYGETGAFLNKLLVKEADRVMRVMKSNLKGA